MSMTEACWLDRCSIPLAKIRDVSNLTMKHIKSNNRRNYVNEVGQWDQH